jgi:pimeloyl-ACP methyl ester carboxylesterase
MNCGKVILGFFVLVIGLIWAILRTELKDDIFLSFEKYCAKFGYEVITYEIVTEDDYVLTLFRIPGKGKPVLLLHGLVVTADSFILNQCAKSPAFTLADNGFDVWLGNLRGNHISYKHSKIDNEHEDYWDFSFEDFVDHDFKSFVDFIKSSTNSEKIIVVGHSLGGAVITNAISLYPDYKNHISLAILLGTPGGIIHPSSLYIRFLASGIVQKLSKIFGFKSFLYWVDSPFIAQFISNFKSVSRYLAKDMMDLDLIGGHEDDIIIYSYRNRGGISVKATEYLVQHYWNQAEQPKRFDFGPEGNVKRYGTEHPPGIFYSNISLNIAIINGKFDAVFTQEDSRIFKTSIPQQYLVYYEDQYELDHAGLLYACNMTHVDNMVKLINVYG